MKHDRYGFSLLEILLAMALAGFLASMLGAVYLSTKKIYQEQRSLTLATENIRFAATFLSQALSVAGYVGGAALSDIAPIAVDPKVPLTVDLENSLQGCNSMQAPPYLQNKIKIGTDCFIVQRASANGTALSDDAAKNATVINVLNNPTSVTNNLILIADFEDADLVRATNIISNSINLSFPLQHAYQKDFTTVTSFNETAYFIGDTLRHYPDGTKIYSLYLLNNRGNKEELLEGVTDMQISYGVADANGAIKKYYRLPEMTRSYLWGRVKSVRLHLTVDGGSGGQARNFNLYVFLRQR